MSNFYVYAYLRSKNTKNGVAGTPYYIGKGRGTRAYRLNHSIPIPKNKERIVFLGKGMSECDAFQAEMLLIYFYGRIDRGTGCLHNHTDGGEGPCGVVRSAAYRKTMSAACLGRRISRETAKKISSSLEGRKRPPFSKTWRENISESLKGHPGSSPGKNHWSKGPDAKAVIEKIRRRQSSKDARRRSKAARSKRRPPITETTRQKMRGSHANRPRIGGRYVKQEMY